MTSKFSLFGWLSAIVLIFGTPHTSSAGGWADTFAALSSGKTIQSGVQQDTSIYSARHIFTIYDQDGVVDNFSATDRIEYSVTNAYTGQDLTFNGTREDLTQWAKENASALLAVIFSGSPDMAIAGTPNANIAATVGASRVFDSLQTVRNNDIRVSGQYDFFTIGKDNIDASGSSGVMAYTSVVGETGKHALGIEIPYRMLDVDDDFGSSLTYLTLNPFYEYSTTSGPSRYSLTVGLNFGGTYVDSAIFDGGGGYFQYGGMIGGAIGRTLTTRLEGRIGLNYQILDRYIPSGQVVDEQKWIADAINDADAEQTLTPAIGMTFWVLPETLSVDANVFRIHALSSDVPDEFKYQTVLNSFVNVRVDNWLVTLGYKTSFEIEDFSDHSIVAAVRYLW
jgi:hypothetical protein